MAIGTQAKRAKPVTQADIIVVLIDKEIAAVTARLRNYTNDPENRGRAQSERAVLVALKGKVERYLRGDLSVLV